MLEIGNCRAAGASPRNYKGREMNMKLCIAVFAALLAGTSFVQAQETIKIATEGVYPPFNYIENGELTGFDVDIANALCAKMEVTCEIVTQDWDGMIPGLLAGKYDAIVASMAITPARKEQVNFSDKYYNTPAHFMAATDAGVTDTSPEALAGKVIGVQGSTTQATFLEQKYGQSDIRTYTSVDDASADLATGRLDLVISDKVLLDEWLKKSSDGSCCELVGEDLMDPSFGEGKGIAVRKEDEDLLIKFNNALATILEDGEYTAINQKYFDFPIY